MSLPVDAGIPNPRSITGRYGVVVPAMTYVGGKNGAGIYQRIINQMPPHETYIEAFLGSGAILRKKRPAKRNIGIDRSPKAIALCQRLAGDLAVDCEFIEGNALQLLPSPDLVMGDSFSNLLKRPTSLIYVDPPYVMDTRKGGDLYDHEMDDDEHRQLLDTLNQAGCMVMISGYRSKLYDDALSGFRRLDYQAQTRRGMVPESLWMNFPEPTALHDYGHLGVDYRDRERIKRKKNRWAAKIAGMDRLERLAIMEALTADGNG